MPLVPVNVAELDPLAMLTLAGTLRNEFELERLIETPPDGALWLRDTVQDVLDDGPRLVGVHERAERAGVEPPLPDWPSEALKAEAPNSALAWAAVPDWMV